MIVKPWGNFEKQSNFMGILKKFHKKTTKFASIIIYQINQTKKLMEK